MPTAEPPRESPGNPRRVSRAPVVLLLAGAALAVGLVLLGAQLASTPAPVPAATPGTAESPRQLNVILRDYRFDPTPLYLFPGETVELNVFNAGMLEHELVLGDASVQAAWAVADAGATPPAPFATAPPASVAPDVGGLRILLGSGESVKALYRVPIDQELHLICNLPGHAEHGMVGEIVLLNR